MGAENPQRTDGSRPASSFDGIDAFEIREIMPAMDRAVGELKPRLEAGDYGLIVCEGASARIPALIIRGVATRINHSRGRSEIPLVTVATAYNTLNDDYVNGYDHGDYEADFWQPEEHSLLPAERRTLMNGVDPLKGGDQRVLVVTEFMQTGKHVRQVGREIHQAGLRYDVVAPSRTEDTRFYRGILALGDTEEIFPTSGHLQHQPGIKGKTHLSGLKTIAGTMRRVDRDRESAQAAGRDVRRAVAMLVAKHKL